MSMERAISIPKSGRFPTRQKQSRLFGRLRLRNYITIMLLAILLAANALCYYLGVCQIYWGSCAVVLLFTAIPFLVTRNSPLAGCFCFPNIFVVLLALFHIGYYVPVRLGIVDGYSYMPSVDSRTGDLAMILYCCALVSFSIGVCFGVMGSKTVDIPVSDRNRVPTARVITWTGAFIIALGLLLFLVFLIQTESISKILALSYTDYWDFLTYKDPRFLVTFVQFMPIGLLFVYLGLWSRGVPPRKLVYFHIASAFYIAWLILIGARGPAFLSAVAILYVRHLCYRRVSNSMVLAAAVAFLFLIPIVASYRNLPASERPTAFKQADLSPLSGILEMGATYRTLYAFSEIFGSEQTPLMMGTSYIKAGQHLLPNLGTHKDSSSASGYYRSIVWITNEVDPLLAAQNAGAGSTGIGEPYANFGFLGVVVFFVLLGFILTVLEIYSLAAKSILSTGILAAIFIPVNWYVRDDIYGTARPVVWCLSIIALVYFLAPRTTSRHQRRFS
jgi:oligosaccharide repeat unit polymerase